MLRIDYYAEDFPSYMGPDLNGQGSLRIDWFDIVWAAITVGKTSLADVVAYGPFSLNELLFRTSMVYANLFQSGTDLRRSPAYLSLDPSEKSAISFFFGMIFAKVVGSRLLDAPWLIHFEKLRLVLPIVLPGRSRPDLIGMTSNGDWIVVEAKGRTNAYEQAAMDKAKIQAGQITSIGGMVPQLRVASQSYFSPNLEIRLSDPPEHKERYDLPLSPEEFMSTYYEPFERIDANSTREEVVEGQEFVFTDLESLGVSVGKSRGMHPIPTDSPLTIVLPQAARREVPTTSSESIGSFLYPDGIAVELNAGWTEDMMRNPPTDRRL
jgi:hypothetical protein